MSFFLNANQQLRSGWKFAAYVAFFLLIWIATGLVISMFVARRNGALVEDQLVLIALNEVALFVPAVAAMWLSVRFIDHRPFRAFGVGFLPRWRRDFFVGLAVAGAMLAVLIGGCYAFGFVSMHWTGGQ